MSAVMRERMTIQEARKQSARRLKEFGIAVEIGLYTIDYHNNWGTDRFPWRVHRDGEVIDEFPTYRFAVAYVAGGAK